MQLAKLIQQLEYIRQDIELHGRVADISKLDYVFSRVEITFRDGTKKEFDV